MLQKLSEQVRACHEYAADAKQKAEAAREPASKATFQDMEKRWLALARNYACVESLGSISPATSDGHADATPEDQSLRLQEISTLLTQEGNLETLYERVLDAAISLMSADMGTMQKYYPEHGDLQLLVSRGFHPESAAFWGRVNRDSATACGMALSLGRRVIVPDMESSDFMAGTADLVVSRRSGLRAAQSTPLVSRSGRLLGMISTLWRKPHHPTEHEFDCWMRSLDKPQTSSNESMSKPPCAKASSIFDGSPPLLNPVMIQSSA